MVLLADLLGDNAALHQVYPLIATHDDWAGNLRRATAHIRSLRAGTAHQQTRDACQLLLAALASLELLPAEQSPALIALELQRDKVVLNQLATPVRERNILVLRQQLLSHRLSGISTGGRPRIPRIVHLIRTESGTDDLPLLQYLCYRSVLAHCDGYRIVLHTHEIPRGPRWETLLPKLELSVGVPPQHLGDVRILGAAHQSDVWRLQQLIETGGFYFDWDLLLLRSPQHLRHHVCVMALEHLEQGFREVLGVSAIGAQPNSQFLATWLATMPFVFNPRHYVAHSTLLARRLALQWPSLVRVQNHHAFYYPGWGEPAMRWLFDPAECLPEDQLREHLGSSTGIHLFCSHVNFVKWASHITVREIASPRCNLARLMRPYL
jgi:hypothetical protein